MRWHNRYELLEPVAGAPGSFRGREIGSGACLILHQLAEGDQPHFSTMLRRLGELRPESSEHVHDIWEFGGKLYVITDLHFGDVSLAEWLQRASASPAPARAVASEFTQFFHTAPPPPQPPSAQSARAASQPLAAGEFTRFMSVSLADDTAEFEAAPRDGGPRAAADTGELTRLFNAKAEPEIRAPEKAPTAPVPVPQRPTRPVGDFTRLLGPMAAEPALLEKAAATQARPAAAVTVAPIPDVGAGAGPGDYTRVVSSPRPAPVIPATATQPQTAGAPSKARPGLRPMLVFSGLAALALALILVFAFWR